jgi:hypothetical protein
VCLREAVRRLLVPPVGGDRGSVLVESALLVALVLLGAIGLVDTASAATTQAALDRSASAMARLARSGLAGGSDLDVLTFLSDPAMAGRLDIRRVVVYRALEADGRLPLACDLLPVTAEPTGVTGTCNVYGPAHLASLAAGTAPPRGCATGSWEAAWCPSTRRRLPPDHIGIVIEAIHQPAVRLVTPSEGRLLRARAVVLADPEVP